MCSISNQTVFSKKRVDSMCAVCDEDDLDNDCDDFDVDTSREEMLAIFDSKEENEEEEENGVHLMSLTQSERRRKRRRRRKRARPILEVHVSSFQGCGHFN